MTQQSCSHCHAVDSIAETPELFYCLECGHWGLTADNLPYAYEDFHDDDWRVGQVPKRPTS